MLSGVISCLKLHLTGLGGVMISVCNLENVPERSMVAAVLLYSFVAALIRFLQQHRGILLCVVIRRAAESRNTHLTRFGLVCSEIPLPPSPAQTLLCCP